MAMGSILMIAIGVGALAVLGVIVYLHVCKGGGG